jgi:thiosulfate/3-mercaptopyruvate sulfurtransferase
MPSVDVRSLLLFGAAALTLGCAGARPAAAPAPAPTPAAAAGEHEHAAPAAPAAEAEHQERMVHNRHFLLSAESLVARHGRAGTVIVHVGRTDSAYLAGHVPGARFLPFSAVSRMVNGIPNEFPPADTMAAAFSRLVIRPDDRIVVYGDDVLAAARAWIALDLLGHADRAALLNGGLAAWRAAGGPVETGPVALPALHIPFAYTWQAQRLVTAEWVRARLHDSTIVLLDTRPADQFGGAETPCRPGQTPCVQIPEARRGHIPGARNLPWADLMRSRDDPMLKSMHQIHEGMLVPLGADRDGVATLVAYCRTGNQAGLGYFVLRWINYPDVRLYDGSFLEWAGLDPARFPVMRAAGGHEHQH